jgi:hypothetical protein
MKLNNKVLSPIKINISDYLWIKSVVKHKSRMGFLKAPAYSNYLNKCKNSYSKSNHTSLNLPENILLAVNNFLSDGVGSFITDRSNELASSIYEKLKYEEKNKNIWSDRDSGRYMADDIYQRFPEIELLFKHVLSPFLESIYQSHYQIFYGKLYKSLRKKNLPVGSEIWHSDGGPGTCINLMVSLSEVNSRNGAMEILPWPYTVEIFKNERKYLQQKCSEDNSDCNNKDYIRTLKANYFEEQIKLKFSKHISQPQGESGTVIAMMNNTIHKGGFPDAGESRYVCIFHIYPFSHKTPYAQYRENGISKKAPYPSKM